MSNYSFFNLILFNIFIFNCFLISVSVSKLIISHPLKKAIYFDVLGI